MRYLAHAALWLIAAYAQAQSPFSFRYDLETRTWTLGNGVVEAGIRLTPSGTLALDHLTQVSTSQRWAPPGGRDYSLFRIRTIGGANYGDTSHFTLVDQTFTTIARQGARQSIVLEDEGHTARVTVELELFAGQPALRYRTRFRNLGPGTMKVNGIDIFPYALDAGEGRYSAFRVKQWAAAGTLGNFEPEQVDLEPGKPGAALVSGAYGLYCGWMAVRNANDRGLFFGWEFDGRFDFSVDHTSSGTLQFASAIDEINQPVRADQELALPAALVGVFQGDWDEAGYRTQRFVEQAIAQPARDANFPYVMWDSWGYQEKIDEATLRRNAEIAARLGIEVFVVDLGWARAIGDWRHDPAKFPSGLRALSDYVHSLGMRFGLHLPLAEASAQSPVLRQNPGWTSSETYQYFNAESICLSHQPVRDWIIGETVRMIDDYNVDWILQDGENMVKHCTRTSHTHDPAGSNWANAVDGLNFVVSAVQRQRPNVRWENCEDGGNMMTYSMTRRYVTSIAADDSGELTTRQAVYGITYPFPPRYSDRYMPYTELDSYVARSYMFGGPWIFMNHLPEMSAGSLELAGREIALFKRLRGRLRTGKVLHLSGRPDGSAIDAIASYAPEQDSAVAFVYRSVRSRPRTYRLRIPGLDPAGSYRLRFEEDRSERVLTGAELAEEGTVISLPRPSFAEIVYIDRAN
ncbi:MAG: alpha-galactosidase [Bryobacteraceae bacterium]